MVSAPDPVITHNTRKYRMMYTLADFLFTVLPSSDPDTSWDLLDEGAALFRGFFFSKRRLAYALGTVVFY